MYKEIEDLKYQIKEIEKQKEKQKEKLKELEKDFIYLPAEEAAEKVAKTRRDPDAFADMATQSMS